MDKYTHCKKAHEIKDKIMDLISTYYDENRDFESEDQAILHCIFHMMLCKHEMPGHNREDWKEFHREVEGAVYPEDHVNMMLTEDELEDWVDSMSHMLNGTEHVGEHWTYEQVTAALKQNAVKFEGLSETEQWALMNAIWHTGHKSAVKEGQDASVLWFANRAYDMIYGGKNVTSPSDKLYHFKMHMC